MYSLPEGIEPNPEWWVHLTRVRINCHLPLPGLWNLREGELAGAGYPPTFALRDNKGWLASAPGSCLDFPQGCLYSRGQSRALGEVAPKL